MRAFNFLASLPNRRFTHTVKMRTTIVLVLTAMLGMLGLVSLTTVAHGSKITPHLTTIKHVIKHATVKKLAHASVKKPVHVRTPAGNESLTASPAHTQPVGYPLSYGNTHLAEIALTFDDGPNRYYTPRVLAILQRYGVQATFFDVGYLVKDYPDIVRQEYNNGNIVGNHSWSHPELTLLSASAISSQLTATSNAIQTTIGVWPIFFRPPYGAFNRTVLDEASSLGVTTVLWDDTAEDWALPGVSVIVNRILYSAHNGAIILLHDGGGNRIQTVAALPTIIRDLKNRGFTFVTLQRLVDDLVTTSSQSAYSDILDTLTSSTVTTTEAESVAWKREI